MGTQYGPYVMYILSQLLQKRQAMEQAQKAGESSLKETAMTAMSAMSAMSALSGLSGNSNTSGLPGALGALAKSENLGLPGNQGDPDTSNTSDTETITIENDFFARDETGAIWHKENKIELLQSFCREGVAQAKRHGHFIIGTRGDANFIGIPGRFLIEEQPAGGKTGFTLWQPLKGGEELYANLEEIDEETAAAVYGYWIAGLDGKTLQIREV